MKVYVFGNQDFKEDSLAFVALKNLKLNFKDLEFITVNPNEDLPFAGEPVVTILDTVEGIKKAVLITENDLDKIINSKSVSVHDWDLGFQLKYLKKLGKLKRVNIIGLPKKGRLNHFLIHSILRKLVAQEMQGS